jgi:fatty acid synthase, animal type
LVFHFRKQDVKEVFARVEFFYLVGYSFGAFVTLELARALEAMGKRGEVVLIDGAPPFLKKLSVDQMTEDYTDESIQIVIMAGIIRMIFPEDNTEIIRIIATCPTWDERVTKLIEFSKEQNIYSEQYVSNMMKALFLRIKIALEADIVNVVPLQSAITLIRPTEVSVIDIDEDYGLSKYTEHPINLKFIEGNHLTMLENPKLGQIINEMDPLLESNRWFTGILNEKKKNEKI